MGLALDLVQGVGGGAALAGDVQQHPDAGQRRAQLVRDRGQQLALILQLALDARGHVVDRPAQDGDLVDAPGGAGGPGRQVAPADLLGHLDQLAQRAGHAAGDLSRQHPERQHREQEQQQPRAAARPSG